MYENFYGFREKPFSLLPDPEYLYLGKKHGMAFTMLEYGLMNRAGITVITGEIGAGKTTLIRHLLNNTGQDVNVGLISNTHEAFGELLQWILLAFGLGSAAQGKADMYQRFVGFLVAEYARGRRTVLIVDEAQNIDPPTLEELRVLSNVNADKDQVLQLILAGQPELRATLCRPNLQQFVQRVAVDYHLGALDAEETGAYIRHRLTVAGGNEDMFEPAAMGFIHERCRGIPRLINTVCDTALVYGFAAQQRRIGHDIVREAIRDRFDRGILGTQIQPAAGGSM